MKQFRRAYGLFAETQSVVHKAIDLGVTLFDTADIYGNRDTSEEFLGRILGECCKDIVGRNKIRDAYGRSRQTQGWIASLHITRN